MGKASSNKKVARASRAAGKKPGDAKSWVWPVIMGLVVVAGVGLVVLSLPGGDDRAAADESPQPGEHWHAAYGINVCGEWLPPLQDVQQDRSGIHTHADGLIHMHPFTSRYAGRNANIGAFAEMVGLEVAEGEVALPDGTTYADGDECDGEPAAWTLTVWEDRDAEEGRVVGGDPADYAPQNYEVVALSFQPEGAEVALPPTAVRLADPLATEEGREPVPLEGVPEPPDDAITEGTDPGTDASPEEGEGGFVEDPELDDAGGSE